MIECYRRHRLRSIGDRGRARAAHLTPFRSHRRAQRETIVDNIARQCDRLPYRGTRTVRPCIHNRCPIAIDRCLTNHPSLKNRIDFRRQQRTPIKADLVEHTLKVGGTIAHAEKQIIGGLRRELPQCRALDQYAIDIDASLPSGPVVSRRDMGPLAGLQHPGGSQVMSHAGRVIELRIDVAVVRTQKHTGCRRPIPLNQTGIPANVIRTGPQLHRHACRRRAHVQIGMPGDLSESVGSITGCAAQHIRGDKNIRSPPLDVVIAIDHLVGMEIQRPPGGNPSRVDRPSADPDLDQIRSGV